MTKTEVLALLEKYKGRVIEIGLSDEGALLHGGIEGHWLFTKGDNLIEVKKNTPDGTYGYASTSQYRSPFVVTTVQFDTVNYVRSYVKTDAGDITTMLDGFTPVATDDTLQEIITAMEGDSIRKASSTRSETYSDQTKYGGEYGTFKGTYISTDLNGIPAYVKQSLNVDE